MPNDGYKENDTDKNNNNNLTENYQNNNIQQRLTVTNFKKVQNETSRLQTGGYRLRNTYYNFCQASDNGVKADDHEKLQFRLHFNDFNDQQRMFLVKCRESFRDRQRGVDALTTDSGHSILSEKSKTKSTNYRNHMPSKLSQFTQRASKAHSTFSNAISTFTGDPSFMMRESGRSTRPGKKRHTQTFGDKIKGFFHDDVTFERNSARNQRHATALERRIMERRAFAQSFSRAERRKLGRQECLIHPSSIIRKVWHLISVIPTLFTLIVVPMEFAFLSQTSHTPKWLQYGNFLCDMFYVMDIVLNYHTGYYRTGFSV